MVKVGASVAIMQDGCILLTQREDFEVWCLPGGISEPGESLAQTAIREAWEETGLKVEIKQLIGIYSRVGSPEDVHGALFLAHPNGGAIKPQVEEVIDIRYFSQDELPDALFWWHRQQIADAFNGIGGGVAHVAHLTPAQPTGSRQELYALRDQMGLSREAFYRYYFESHGTDNHHREVGPEPA